MDATHPPGIHARPLKSAPLEWNGPAVSVVSLGCTQPALLSDEARRALEQAQVIFGAPRHIQAIGHVNTAARKLNFPSPFSDLRDLLQRNQSEQIAVLASGDALLHGVGDWLVRLLPAGALRFHAHVSSVQHAFHAAGLPWRRAEIVSLHGRPLSTLRRHLRHNHLLAVFTDARNHPRAIAGELVARGFGASEIRVCENLGGSGRKVSRFSAGELGGAHGPDDEFDPLNLCIIHAQRPPGEPAALPAFPGIPDHLFSTGAEAGGGMLSKREVRLAILSLMQPEYGETAWDIGAGCGGVSVEWARWNPLGQLYAIEQSERRMQHLVENNERFGTRLNLTPVQGTAPRCCDALPDPDSIFIGGSGGLGPMLDYAWRRLRPGGKLTASAVTQTSMAALDAFMRARPGHERVRIQVDKNLPGDGNDAMRTLAPVLIGKCAKPGDAR